MMPLVLACGLARAALFAEYGRPMDCYTTPRGETCSWRRPPDGLEFVQFCGSVVCGAWEWRALRRYETLACERAQ